jgi:hypothetical protein
MEKLVNAILILFVLIVIYYISVFAYNAYYYDSILSSYRLPKINGSKITLQGQVNTGDIVLFKSFRQNIPTQFVLGVFFTHIGIIVVKDGQAYVHEITNFGDEITPWYYSHDLHPKTTKLSTRIKYYRGHMYIMKLHNKLLPYQENVLIDRIGKRDIIYEKSQLISLLRGLFHHKSFKNMLCVEYLAWCLSIADITDRLYNTHFINLTRSIFMLPGQKLNYGNFYEPIIEIINDF